MMDDRTVALAADAWLRAAEVLIETKNNSEEKIEASEMLDTAEIALQDAIWKWRKTQ